MKIQVFGTGCAKCKKLTENAETALKELGIDAGVEKVTDMKEIVKAGVLTTPALSVDGQVKSVGKVLSPAEIKAVLKKIL